ncbi:hypothetical protein Pyn_39239 [Prunus yedoensis var. nudiflora]|uniref:Uncharacterized protein n=1 Tax=Prunus yedoensis var. nudiflora TaxID=2094558 RepID=A0A314XZR7_PRUYE|nr:hypothetical protein Pyn_39239 [Prunus yedoensis var. nudiflora]
MAKFDEGKKVTVPVGLRGGILPCMPKSLGSLDSLLGTSSQQPPCVDFQRSSVICPQTKCQV